MAGTHTHRRSLLSATGRRSCTLKFEGNPGDATDTTVFLDAVEIFDALGQKVLNVLLNPSFEAPPISSGYLYNPPIAQFIWTTNGGALSTYGSQFEPPRMPDSSGQCFCLQGNRSIGQTIMLPIGSYTLKYYAAQRRTGNYNNTIKAYVNNDLISSYQPALVDNGPQFFQVTSNSFSLY